tara:strand:- start:15327 stop:15974 length:648 start_codon:yes stop_codon:yes gene_type:complete
MGYMTKLDAVNQMLISAGEGIVSDLENKSGVDTSVCEFMLEQKIVDYQMRGLANNQQQQCYETSNKDKTIELPNNVLSGWLISTHTNSKGDQIRGIVRGANPPYLYNLTDNTKEWSENVEYKVYLVLKFDWEDMDTNVQKAIVMQAAREYQMLSQGDGDVDNYLAQLSMYYDSQAKGSDNTQKRYNIFSGPESSVTGAVNRNRTWNYNRYRYPTT